MKPPFETRRDFKEAGKALGIELSDAMAKEINRIAVEAPEVLTDEFVDELQEKQFRVVAEISAGHIAAGAPPMWVAKFRSAYLLSAGKRMREYQIAARRAAGTA